MKHPLADWCGVCGLLVPSTDMLNGVCRECRTDGWVAPLDPTDAEIERALKRMDRVLGPGWLESE